MYVLSNNYSEPKAAVREVLHGHDPSMLRFDIERSGIEAVALDERNALIENRYEWSEPGAYATERAAEAARFETGEQFVVSVALLDIIEVLEEVVENE